MANNLTTFMQSAGLPQLSDEQMAAALGAAVNDQQTGDGTGVQYLSFSGKMGTYALGRDRIDVQPDQPFLLEPTSFMHGFICWKASKPQARVEWSIFEPQHEVSEDDLDDHGPYNVKTGEGWHKSLGFGCVALDEGTQVKFSTNSVSGRNAITDVMLEIQRRISAKSPHLPVFGFDCEQFTAQGSVNFKPKFQVMAWVTRDEAAAVMNGDMDLDTVLYGADDAPEEPAPAPARTRAASKGQAKAAAPRARR